MTDDGILRSGFVRRLVHGAVWWFQQSRRALWFVTRPAAVGVHAIPLTPEGRILLVKLSYAHGWRVPGGGLRAGEAAEEGILRELREEIGLIAHSALEPVTEFEHRPDFRRARGSLFVVRGVAYRARWSLEVKDVREFDPSALPADLPEITRRLLAAARQHF